MPKTYSEEEKNYIIERLKEEARACMQTYGIRKTTVDELVARVHIPKGTFYLFYDSKERLLFDALLDIDTQIHGILQEKVGELSANLTVDSLTDCIFLLFSLLDDTCIPKVLESGEFEILYRKLPKEVIAEHMQEDDQSMLALFKMIGLGEEGIKRYSAAFRSVFLTLSMKDEIGREVFPEVLHLMIRGIVIQMMEK